MQPKIEMRTKKKKKRKKRKKKNAPIATTFWNGILIYHIKNFYKMKPLPNHNNGINLCIYRPVDCSLKLGRIDRFERRR